MMEVFFTSLRAKIMLSVVSTVMLGFAVTIYAINSNADKMQREAALRYADVLAEKNATSVKATIEVALDSARTLANSLQGMKSQGITSRKAADAMLRQVLESNPEFIGVWTCRKPDAFDGKDREYVNTPGTDSSGHYVPYWNRGTGKVALEPLLDYNTSGAGDYCLLPMRTGRETVIEPYHYKVMGRDVLMTSLVVPIKAQGHFVGVAGIDLPMVEFQALVSRIKPYQTGYALLISNGGLYVADVDPGNVGKDIRSFPAALKAKPSIKAGQIYRDFEFDKRLKTEAYKVYVPVNIGHTATPWSFAITVPMDRVLAGVTTLRNIDLAIGIVSIVILLLVIAAVLNELVNRPLATAMGAARQLSEGNLETHINVKSRDEMGQLLSAMRNMAERLSEMKRIETELTIVHTQIAIARQIQQSLFPNEPPAVEGVLLAGRCVPATQIGGDYFDYFQPKGHPDGLDIFIGDVSGHGIGPALIMAEARTILRSGTHLTDSPAQVLAGLNAELFDDLDRAEQFITMFYATYNIESRMMTYASAGHNPPVILRRRSGSCMELNATGLILGVMPNIAFEENQLQLQEGDLICFYTDGVTEAENPAGDQYGLNRLGDCLERHRAMAPVNIIDALLEELKAFCQCPTFTDDVTMIVMKVAKRPG